MSPSGPQVVIVGAGLAGVAYGWGQKPKVETAWVSGTSLGQALARRLDAT